MNIAVAPNVVNVPSFEPKGGDGSSPQEITKRQNKSNQKTYSGKPLSGETLMYGGTIHYCHLNFKYFDASSKTLCQLPNFFEIATFIRTAMLGKPTQIRDNEEMF